MVTKMDTSRKFRSNNEANTNPFFMCPGYCTYKAPIPIELLTAPLSSSNSIPATMRTIIVSFVIAPFGGYLLWKLYARRARNISTVQHRYGNPKACMEILACTGYASGDRNAIPAVESRARSNQRLVKAFNIDNAFTTKDDEDRKSFTREATAKMSALKEADWKRIAAHANALLSYALGERNAAWIP